jgi:hypothetical protein
MTEAQRIRLLELAIQVGAAPTHAVALARQLERYVAGESGVVPTQDSTPDSYPQKCKPEAANS